jgi:hypothetical protein
MCRTQDAAYGNRDNLGMGGFSGRIWSVNRVIECLCFRFAISGDNQRSAAADSDV